MKLKRYMWAIAAMASISLAACSDDNFDPYAEAPEPPIPDLTPPEIVQKPKAMWIDCEANFRTLSTKEGIDAELAKIKRYGLNMIYLDVKPGNGYALYKSDIVPYCNTYGNQTVTRDYDDFLAYFLEKCEELDINVIASVGSLGFGYQAGGVNQGLIFDQWDKWGDKVQVRSDTSNPNITVKITEDLTQPITMLDPLYPEVQDIVVSLCTEIVTKYSKYPKFKGISLDYLRFNNNDGGFYGMSDYDLVKYAEYWKESKPQRTEIVTATGGIGPKFAKWIEFRSMAITDLLGRIRSSVKAVNPDCEIHLWASADWGTRYSVGQNWASKKYKPQAGSIYTETYSKTGFADLLDVFITGAYTEHVWKRENPTSVWTVENFVMTWNNYIMDDCKCYGSIATYALSPEKLSDATYLCLKYTDGYMNFELSHTNNGNKWLATQEGINRYERNSSNENEE